MDDHTSNHGGEYEDEDEYEYEYEEEEDDNHYYHHEEHTAQGPKSRQSRSLVHLGRENVPVKNQTHLSEVHDLLIIMVTKILNLHQGPRRFVRPFFEGGRHMDWSNKMCFYFLKPCLKL